MGGVFLCIGRTTVNGVFPPPFASPRDGGGRKEGVGRKEAEKKGMGRPFSWGLGILPRSDRKSAFYLWSKIGTTETIFSKKRARGGRGTLCGFGIWVPFFLFLFY